MIENATGNLFGANCVKVKPFGFLSIGHLDKIIFCLPWEKFAHD